MTDGTPILTTLLAFAIAAVATPLVRAFARRFGVVARPKNDRWHRKATALMGGVAIYIAVITTILYMVPLNEEVWAVIAASSALFLLGLVDDFLHLKPYQKLAGQICAAGGIVYLGLVLPWTASFAVNMIITFVWLVGVTNAVNMLDNMDGLAAGVAAIAGVSLAVTFFLNGQPEEALMLAAFFGALLGFLIYNHNPASIFMGDGGSMFIGFFLASTALLASQSGVAGRSRSVLGALAVPVLVLCIPIFDTTFVTLARKLVGRPASQGGRDHTSHRLVALGLSERNAVWMMYVLAILGGAIAIGLRDFDTDVSVGLIVVFALVLALAGVYLARVKVYSETEIERATQKPLVAFLVDLSYKRRIFEIALDVVLIVFAYYWAYALLFGPLDPRHGDWQLFLTTLPAVVAVKLLAFLLTGVYRGIWRYAGVGDLMIFFRGVFLGSATCVLLVVYAFRFVGFSRTAFLLDGIFLLVLVASSRFAFRLFGRMLPHPHSRTGRRVLIFGAGDAGDLMWRELNNNSALQCVPIGFIDDDPHKVGKVIHGLTVHSGEQSLSVLCTSLNADEVLLSTTKVPLSRIRTLVEDCRKSGVTVKRMKIDLQTIADDELGRVLPTSDDAATTESVLAMPRIPVAAPPTTIEEPDAVPGATLPVGLNTVKDNV